MSKSLLTNIYKLYILCLPLGRLFDLPFGDSFNKVITQFSTLIMLLGVFLIFMIRGIRLGKERNNIFVKIYAYMVIVSVVMAFVLTFSIETYSESPLSAIIGDIVLYLFVILSVYFNTYCLSHCIRVDKLYRLFDWQIVILLIVGYSQFFGIRGFEAPYNLLSSVFALRELSWLVDLDRGVTFFGSEPSSAAILCFVVMPYLYSSIQNQRGYKRTLYIIALSMFLFLVFCSNSSQFLILFIGSALLFLWSCFKPIRRYFYYISFACGAFFALEYLAVESVTMTSNSDYESLEYVILGKIVDRENQSTAMRASTVINDLKVFAEYPIVGVGDGNQGFFYANNQPSWTKASREVSDLISRNVIPNGGGNFFPAYISAYGILGIFVLLLFISKYRKLYRTSILMADKRIDLIFQIAMILFLFAGWHVVGIKQSETIIFILSLPCLELNNCKLQV